MERQNLQDELKKAYQLVKRLTKEIDYKNHKLAEMQLNFDDTAKSAREIVVGLMEKLSAKDRNLVRLEQINQESTATVRWLMKEKAVLRDGYIEEVRNFKSTNIKLKNNLEYQRKEMEQLTEKLEEWKAQNDLKQRSLMDDIEKLKGDLRIHNIVGCTQNDNSSLIKSNADIDALRSDLKEKEETIQYFESLNHTLIVKESMSNQELQDARKEAISGLQDILNNRTVLGIKRMGEIDCTPFRDACLLKFSNEDWEEISGKLCSMWEEYVKDPLWHPFKKEIIKGRLQEIIDDDDERLKELRNEYGEGVYEAVTNALLEVNEYNPSGRYTVCEIWNVKERRRASLKEVIQYVIKQLKCHKRKRRF